MIRTIEVGSKIATGYRPWLLAALLTLAACGGGSSSNGNQPGAGNSPTELNWDQGEWDRSNWQ